MEITTKHSIGDTVYFLERKNISKQCSTCEGAGRINVTKGVLSWNIKCPDCNGKRKTYDVLRYNVATAVIKGVSVKRGNQTATKYVLSNGMHKNESALFAIIEEAEQRRDELNGELVQSRKDKEVL